MLFRFPSLLVSFSMIIICESYAEPESALYKEYVNASAVDFDGQTGTYSPDVDFCVALATVAASNGAMFNDASKTCVVLTVFNNEILVKLHTRAGWTTYVKDMSTEKRLVIKFQNALSSVVTDNNIIGIWSGTGGSYTTTYNSSVASVNVSNACNCHYRNPVLSTWNIISKVYMRVYHNSLPVSQIVFDASNSTSNTWVQRNRVLSAAPYSVQQVATNQSGIHNFQLVKLQCTNQGRFVMLIGGPSTICNLDTYFMLVSNEKNCSCTYSSTPSPWVFYSASRTVGTRQEQTLLQGDFYHAYVEVSSRTVFTP